MENTSSCGACFIRGLGLHLTNPKAIFFFGSLYALSIPDEASAGQVVAVILTLALIGATIFFGYAVLFACAPVMKAYSMASALYRSWIRDSFLFREHPSDDAPDTSMIDGSNSLSSVSLRLDCKSGEDIRISWNIAVEG